MQNSGVPDPKSNDLEPVAIKLVNDKKWKTMYISKKYIL